MELGNGLLPIWRLDRRMAMCWVELHYGTVCLFFWRGEWANFDQFSAQPRNSQASPNSPMMHFDTAATDCHVQPQNSWYKLWWGGVERSWGEGENLKMWINLNKSALRFSIDRKHFWKENFSKTRTITWLLSIYKRQTEDITSIFGINWRIKMPFCNLSRRLPSLSSKERKVPSVLQPH